MGTIKDIAAKVRQMVSRSTVVAIISCLVPYVYESETRMIFYMLFNSVSAFLLMIYCFIYYTK